MTIKSIIEAYAHVPNSFEVISEIEYEQMLKNKNPNVNLVVKKILPKTMSVSNKEVSEFLVGYNFKDEIIFKYLANSVNIQYQ
jgi:hypothetical protein